MAGHNEFPPLRPAGYHRLTLEEIKALCVKPYALSTTRSVLCEALELVVHVLADAGLKGQIWLDGSFVTEKIVNRTGNLGGRII